MQQFNPKTAFIIRFMSLIRDRSCLELNAAEQAKGLEVTTKIAAVVNLFKSQFPDAKADLTPWKNDPDTQELVDPDSIDIGFHLPGWSRKLQSRSILVQIRFYEDPSTATKRAIGIQVRSEERR